MLLRNIEHKHALWTTTETSDFGCWYVQTTGIYKTVWLEYVDEVYVTALKITPVLQDYSVRFDVSVNQPADDVEVHFAVSFDGKPVQTACVIASDVENTVKGGRRAFLLLCGYYGLCRLVRASVQPLGV